MLLALGAATVGVLVWTLVTSTGTAAAHTPEGVDKDHDTPVTGQVDKDGSCAGITVGTNQRCDEDSKEESKGRWYHQNYWRPYRCDRVEKTVSGPPGENGPTTETVVEWENCRVDWTGTNLQRHGLQFFTDHPDPLPKSGERAYPSPSNQTAYWSLTDDTAKKDLEPQYWRYLRRLGNDGPLFQNLDGVVPPDGGQANGYRSWCGAVPTENEAKDTGGADCRNQGHHGNNDHRWWTHGAVQGPPLVETVFTHTIYDLHDHCDDANTVHRNEDGECPDPKSEVCPLPAAPTVTKHETNDGPPPRQRVAWEVDDPEGAGCEVTGWVIQYGNETARELPDRNTRESWERRPGPGSRIRVYVRAENPVDPDDKNGDKQLGNSGWVDLECRVPAAPVVSWSTSLERVSWTRPDAGGPSLVVNGYRIMFDPTGSPATDPLVLPTSPRSRAVTQPDVGSGPLTVLVGARNNDCGWGGYGRVTVPAKQQPPPGMCPKPDAPTVFTANPPHTREHPEKQQEVEWTVTNPDHPCEITGQRIRYGTGTPRDLRLVDVRQSWERQPGPGSRIRVYVSVKNPVRTDRTGEQWSNAGYVDLYGECPAGTTHAGKPMDDPAVGGTVEGCNDDDGGCPLPAAPVLTSDPEDTDSSRLVTWTVADPAGEDCEITGQELRRVPQRGISSTRDRDKNTRQSTQSVTDRTGAVVVSVRAKNRVQPGSRTEQRGGWGSIPLSPPDDEEKPSRCATATVDA